MLRNFALLSATLSMGLLLSAQEPSSGTSGQKPAPTAAAALPTAPVAPKVVHSDPPIDDVIENLINREHDEVANVTRMKPIVETYMQIEKRDKSLGMAPGSDFYFLGQASFGKEIKVKSLLAHTKTKSLMYSYYPSSFLSMAFVDPTDFDKKHYDFRYAGQDFQGEFRCFIFDIHPLPKTKSSSQFNGRIWVESDGFNIVRINGSFSPDYHFSWTSLSEQYRFHFDSWRSNVRPGEWLPSYIYAQEVGRDRFLHGPMLKAQTRLWGFHAGRDFREDEFTDLKIEAPVPIADEGENHDRSPLEAVRLWRREAEENTLDALETDGLLAPVGPVERVLNQIVTNIEVTNKLDDRVDLHCRVLLTSSFEMFSVENTIILSRGLIDVIPDENVMAVLLAEEVADAMMPKPYQDQYAFSDEVRVSTTEIMKKLSFEDEKQETVENEAKALELISNSPYAGKLGKADLFFDQLRLQSKQLKQLISPRLGNQVMSVARAWNGEATLDPTDKDQIAALPLGSRIKLDPYDDSLEFLRTSSQPILSMREKMPFEVVPLYPYATKYQAPQAAETGSAVVSAGNH